MLAEWGWREGIPLTGSMCHGQCLSFVFRQNLVYSLFLPFPTCKLLNLPVVSFIYVHQYPVLLAMPPAHEDSAAGWGHETSSGSLLPGWVKSSCMTVQSLSSPNRTIMEEALCWHGGPKDQSSQDWWVTSWKVWVGHTLSFCKTTKILRIICYCSTN